MPDETFTTTTDPLPGTDDADTPASSVAAPLARLLNLQPGEGRLVSLLLGYSFFRGVTITFFYVASSALFLSS